MPDIGWCPESIRQSLDGVACSQAHQGIGEVVAARSEYKSRPYDDVLPQDGANTFLTRHPAPPVDRQRIRHVELVVRRSLLTVEDVVRRNVKQHGSRSSRREREVFRADRIYPDRLIRVSLAPLDVGHRCE